jgi:hypothetical protein
MWCPSRETDSVQLDKHRGCGVRWATRQSQRSSAPESTNNRRTHRITNARSCSTENSKYAILLCQLSSVIFVQGSFSISGWKVPRSTYPYPGVLNSCHYEEVVVNSTCQCWRTRTDLVGDHVLDLTRTLNHLKVAPRSFPFFQSIYALTNGVTGEHRVVETCSPDTDKVSQELRMTDSIIELSERALARGYVVGM